MSRKKDQPFREFSFIPCHNTGKFFFYLTQILFYDPKLEMFEKLARSAGSEGDVGAGQGGQRPLRAYGPRE
jgi:hypothetical protein